MVILPYTRKNKQAIRVVSSPTTTFERNIFPIGFTSCLLRIHSALMARRASFGSSSKAPSAPKHGYLEKLKQLRSFVGPTISEDVLNACLKQCGCDVNIAATKLMTGEFNHADVGKKRGSSSFFNLTKNLSPDRTIQEKKPRISIGTMVTPKLAAKPTPKAAAPQANPVTPDNNKGSYLLCQRWLSVESRSKGGQVSYQEKLHVTCSSNGPPMVRVSGIRAEGLLPRNLCTMLAPLNQYLQLTAESLMEDKHLQIGTQFPVNLR